MIGQRTNGVLGWLEDVGYDLRTEVQVLSPIKGGPAGTKSLNRMLQLTLNPRAAAAAATATNGGAAAADAADAAAAGVAGPCSPPPAAPPTARRRASSACGSATPWPAHKRLREEGVQRRRRPRRQRLPRGVGAAVPGGVRDRRRHRRRRGAGRRERQRRAAAGGRLLEGEPRQGCGALVRDDGAHSDASRTQGGASPHRSPAPLTPLLPPLRCTRRRVPSTPSSCSRCSRSTARCSTATCCTPPSRARAFLVLVGDERAIETAVGEDKMQRREIPRSPHLRRPLRVGGHRICSI